MICPPCAAAADLPAGTPPIEREAAHTLCSSAREQPMPGGSPSCACQHRPGPAVSAGQQVPARG
jgi:hypothetical protein